MGQLYDLQLMHYMVGPTLNDGANLLALWWIRVRRASTFLFPLTSDVKHQLIGDVALGATRTPS